MFCILNLFLVTLRKSVWKAITLVLCITLSWLDSIYNRYSLWIFDGEHRERNTGESGESFIEFQLTLRKSVWKAIRLVLCITLLWLDSIYNRYSLWIFDGEHRERNTGKWSDTSLLMIPFLSFNKVSKIKFVNILSIKETVLDVTLVGFVGSYSSVERAKTIYK